MPNLIRNLFAKPWLVLVSLLCLLSAIPFRGISAGKGEPLHKPCETCTINGGTTGIQGQAGIYTLTGGTTAGWTVSNGATIIRSTSPSVTVQFNNLGTTNIDTTSRCYVLRHFHQCLRYSGAAHRRKYFDLVKYDQLWG